MEMTLYNDNGHGSTGSKVLESPRLMTFYDGGRRGSRPTAVGTCDSDPRVELVYTLNAILMNLPDVLSRIIERHR